MTLLRRKVRAIATALTASCVSNLALAALSTELSHQLDRVLAATCLAMAAAIGLRLGLSRITPSRPQAQRRFLVIIGLTLVGAFVVAPSGDLPRWVMLILTAISAVLAAEWAARPEWNFGGLLHDERPIHPRVAVVTGATSGIGAEVARALATRGFRVIGVGRDAGRARALEARHPGVKVVTGDLSLMREAGRIAREVNGAAGPGGIGVVVHCAGTLKPKSQPTTEGIDQNFASSFLGRFALTEALELAPGRRIVNVAAAENGELPSWMRADLSKPEHVANGMRSHGQAQLANDLWTASLARRGWAAFGYGPGSVESGIRREIPALLRIVMGPFFAPETRSAEEAARDIVRLLLDPTLPDSGFASRDGVFEHDRFIHDTSRQDGLVALARALSSRPGTT